MSQRLNSTAGFADLINSDKALLDQSKYESESDNVLRVEEECSVT